MGDGFSLNNQLASDLEFDFTNANENSSNNAGVYTYRLKQTVETIMNRTASQLTLTLWSG